ncbi:MAG: succinate dehydrogenase cytochrome b subunit [Opitutales bacterium]
MSSEASGFRIPSILKKILVALTGLVWVGYVAGHMAGNLQFFGPPSAINEYAYFLHNVMPPAMLWGVRIVLVLALVVHVWMIVLLTLENKRARPENYAVDKTVQATIGSRTMRFSGAIVLTFIVVHILHFTVRALDPLYGRLQVIINDTSSQDVYAMTTVGFSNIGFSVFYIVAMGLLCLHLSHGVSSMFQTVGLRNKTWEGPLNKIAYGYGAVIFIGFASIPVAVLLAWYGGVDIGSIQDVKVAVESMSGFDGDIFIDYDGANALALSASPEGCTCGGGETLATVADAESVTMAGN